MPTAATEGGLPGIAVLILLVMLPFAAMEAQDDHAHEDPGGTAHAAANVIDAGRFSLFGAVGTINGARLGLRFAPLPAASLEISGGYVRVALIRESGRREGTHGYSCTVAGTWFTHPDAVVRPMLTLSAIYVRTGRVIENRIQQRVAVIPAIGSEYSFRDGFSLFFRFGPAFQLTMDPGENTYETLTQFDAGLMVRL